MILRAVAAFAAVFLFIVSNPAEARKAQQMVPPSLYITVHLGSQSMVVSANNTSIGRYKVSTGKVGHRTPRGSWRVQRMARVHWSRQFKAPLPHAIFFTGGIAIHATKGVQKLGTAASHGCVRLAPDDAARVYAMVARHGMKKTLVTVTY